ncbi:LuxR C-terminal-related transcriptional regulator [Streptomyces sp. NPDC008343]|uniref:LuxR C-terminal-related transcriptional regulator n=1 Tax=Streptomyces sp. NPDC008343 TaxID=3364828 RepID=UPI0036E1D218
MTNLPDLVPPDSPVAPAPPVAGTEKASARCADVLSAAALFSGSFCVSDLAAAMDTTVVDLTEPLQEALENGLMAAQGHHLMFLDQQTREAVYARIPEPAKAHIHVAMAMLRWGALPEDIAEQILLGRDAWDATVGRSLLGIAESVTRRQPPLAVSLLTHAVRCGSELSLSDSDISRLRALLAQSQLLAGAASQLIGQAPDPDDVSDPLLRRRLHSVLVQADLFTGRPDRALARITTSMERAHAEDDPWLRGLLVASLLSCGEIGKAETQAEILLAEGSPGAEPEMYARTARSIAHYVRGQAESALHAADQGLARAAGVPAIHPDDLCRLQLVRSNCLILLGKAPEASQAIDAAQLHAETVGGSLSACHAARAKVLFLTGEWDQALAHTDAGLRTRDNSGLQGYFQSLAALILTYRGRVEEAQERLARLEAGPYLMATYQDDVPPWAYSALDEARRHHARALGRLMDGWRKGFGPYAGQALAHQAADLVRLAIRLEERTLAEEVTVTLEKLDPVAYPPYYSAMAAQCRGLLSGDLHVLESAESYYRCSPRVLARARYFEDKAAVLAAGGFPKEARRSLGRALDIYAALRAEGCAAQARERLKHAGLTRLTSARRADFGWESLTPTERNVAQKVGQGLSNPAIANQMFMARSTVHIHVSNVLRKLQLASRVELAVAIARHENDGENRQRAETACEG